jgi:hypothetical protein
MLSHPALGPANRRPVLCNIWYILLDAMENYLVEISHWCGKVMNSVYDTSLFLICVQTFPERRQRKSESKCAISENFLDIGQVQKRSHENRKVTISFISHTSPPAYPYGSTRPRWDLLTKFSFGYKWAR